MDTIFARASKKKLRFNTDLGMLSVDDLWDLDLLSESRLCLNDLAKHYNQLVKGADEDNFVEAAKVTTSTTDDKLRFELVKHVIDYKLTAATKAETAAKRKQKRELILQIVDEKDNEKLKGMSRKKLLEMIDEEDAEEAA